MLYKVVFVCYGIGEDGQEIFVVVVIVDGEVKWWCQVVEQGFEVLIGDDIVVVYKIVGYDYVVCVGVIGVDVVNVGFELFEGIEFDDGIVFWYYVEVGKDNQFGYEMYLFVMLWLWVLVGGDGVGLLLFLVVLLSCIRGFCY